MICKFKFNFGFRFRIDFKCNILKFRIRSKSCISSVYRKHAIITRGLYIYHPIFEELFFVFQKGFFQKILSLCMISIQERFMLARVRYMYGKQRSCVEDTRLFTFDRDVGGS